MVELVRKQRHFIILLSDTTPKQRNQLIRTITRDQLKAISQIAHNIIKFIIVLSSSEKAKLKRHKRFIHLIGSKKLGFIKKKGAIFHHQRAILTLLQIAIPHLKTVFQ